MRECKWKTYRPISEAKDKWTRGNTRWRIGSFHLFFPRKKKKEYHFLSLVGYFSQVIMCNKDVKSILEQPNRDWFPITLTFKCYFFSSFRHLNTAFGVYSKALGIRIWWIYRFLFYIQCIPVNNPVRMDEQNCPLLLLCHCHSKCTQAAIHVPTSNWHTMNWTNRPIRQSTMK